MTHEVKIGDKVSHPKWGVYEVWKISQWGIHGFRIDDKGKKWHIVFHFKPYHHGQTTVSEITIVH